MAVAYQRSTGPTYGEKTKVVINETEYRFNLTTSHGGNTDCRIELEIPDQMVEATIKYRKYPTHDAWTEAPMQRKDSLLTAFLPHQPPAGKLEYIIIIKTGGSIIPLNKGKSIIIRFKGDVPAAVLLPHVLFMFLSMFLSNLAGIMAIFRQKKYILYSWLTLIALFIGGIILGPLVQWFAFGEAWAGVPFAWDLTDNKTLLAFIFWGLAIIMNHKRKGSPAVTIVASAVMLVVYLIPHSMYGSELDPETGEIIQGWMTLFF